MGRKRYSLGTKWEPLVGYSRGVRAGPYVHVSGTTATDETGQVVGVGDPYRQAVQTIQNIHRALRAPDADLEDVVRTRMYVVDIENWEEIGRAHGEFFGEVRPASTVVEVRRLITPEILVEIETEAIVSG